MSASALRRALGDRHLRGSGFEIGAGAAASFFQGVERLTFVDKRSASELADLFQTTIDYDVLPLDAALRTPAQDFLTAHHVLEHAADPIGALRAWAPLVREGGTLYLSLPSADSPWEKDRAPAPIDHLVHDHLFDRHEDSFESRQHIPHFIDQWTVAAPNTFWFADEGVEKFARFSLWEARREGPVDVHWHAFTLETLRAVSESAFWLAGAGLCVLDAVDDGEELHLVARVTPRGPCPAALATAVAAIRTALEAKAGAAGL